MEQTPINSPLISPLPVLALLVLALLIFPAGAEESPRQVLVLRGRDYTLAPVDRGHRLPPGYKPELQAFPFGAEDESILLTPEAGAALGALFSFAHEEGLSLEVRAAYRSAAYQGWLHEYWIQDEMAQGFSPEEAAARADRYSTLPGFSEHHLGTAVDINETGTPPFEEKKDRVYRFLQEKAHLFGFILSYPEGKEELTGYQFEPWHIRFVGRPLAEELYRAGYLTPGPEGGPAPNQFLAQRWDQGELPCINSSSATKTKR